MKNNIYKFFHIFICIVAFANVLINPFLHSQIKSKFNIGNGILKEGAVQSNQFNLDVSNEYELVLILDRSQFKLPNDSQFFRTLEQAKINADIEWQENNQINVKKVTFKGLLPCGINQSCKYSPLFFLNKGRNTVTVKFTGVDDFVLNKSYSVALQKLSTTNEKSSFILKLLNISDGFQWPSVLLILLTVFFFIKNFNSKKNI